ncbi:MAG: hypothetical protein BV458_07215 [Thermoplasmata archaeon M9B2D]|nr:MAG: hypothetical protein BV458_07215 [Thermoplasmata archaeon M9B2D]
MWIELPLLIVIVILLYIFVILKVIRRVWHFPAPAFIGRGLNSRPRKRIQPPRMLVEALGLRPGAIVAEIGCGPGTFTIDVAKAVSPNGHVYAIDIQQGMLDQLQSNIDREHIANVYPILADASGRIPLDEESVDFIYSVTVLPEIPDRIGALKEVRRLLKSGGLYADAELVFDPDWPLPRTVKKWADAAGFSFKKQLGSFLRYVLVFSKE